MMDEEEVIRRMNIIAANNVLFDILEECDSQVCFYTWEALIAGSCELILETDDGT
jgi:hypothetical protein